MAFTLNDAKQLSQDKLTQFVIDEFRKSPVLDALVWDDCVKPQGGQSLTYSYNRVSTQPTAAIRTLNSEYTAQEAKTTQVSVHLSVLGGSFALDRVLIEHEKQAADLVQFQVGQKLKATRALFSDLLINGDTSTSGQFDGLSKALSGSSTEYTISGGLDLSDATKIEAGWKKMLYHVRQTIKGMDGAPTIAMMNKDMFAVLQTVADYATGFQLTRNDLGQELIRYGNAVLMDVGDKPGTSNPIVADGSIYFARIGLDGLHGVTPDGVTSPRVYLPDLTKPGAVKLGEVEMVAAMALKSTKAAAVLKGVVL